MTEGACAHAFSFIRASSFKHYFSEQRVRTYVNIDDCRHGERDPLGFIRVDAKRFPTASGQGAKRATRAVPSRPTFPRTTF